MLRHRRIIDRRDPEPAGAQFVAEAIHPFAIADHERHHVGGGVAGVDPEAAQLPVKIIGVFPEPRAQLRLSLRDFERLQNRRDHDRRQRAGIDIRMRVEAQVLQRLARARDEAAERAEGFREGPVSQPDAIFDPEFFRRPTAMLTAGEGGMRLVDEDARAVFFRDFDQPDEVSEIAIHRVNAFDHDQLAAALVSA